MTKPILIEDELESKVFTNLLNYHNYVSSWDIQKYNYLLCFSYYCRNSDYPLIAKEWRKIVESLEEKGYLATYRVGPSSVRCIDIAVEYRVL